MTSRSAHARQHSHAFKAKVYKMRCLDVDRMSLQASTSGRCERPYLQTRVRASLVAASASRAQAAVSLQSQLHWMASRTREPSQRRDFAAAQRTCNLVPKRERLCFERRPPKSDRRRSDWARASGATSRFSTRLSAASRSSTSTMPPRLRRPLTSSTASATIITGMYDTSKVLTGWNLICTTLKSD